MLLISSASSPSFRSSSAISGCAITAGAAGATGGAGAGAGFGTTADANTYTFVLQNPRGGACAPAGPMRCPNILVPAGGLARICDPLVNAATDSRGC